MVPICGCLFQYDYNKRREREDADGVVGGSGWHTVHSSGILQGKQQKCHRPWCPAGCPPPPGVRHKAVPELEACCGESGGGVGLRHGGGGGGTGRLVWVVGGRTGWVKTGTTGTTLTLYLERSYSIERRNANKFSAPLQRRAAPGKKERRVRSTAAHPALRTAEHGEGGSEGREKSLC